MKFSCSVHLGHVFQYLSYIHIKKKERERKRDTNSQQERKYDAHLGGGPSFYLKIIALVRVQDTGTFEVAIVCCYDNDIVIQLTF